MRRFARLATCFAALLLTFAATRSADAADQKAALDKIKAKNQAAQSAFGASDFEEMKSQLMEAVAIGNESGLAKAKILAQTYVLLGVLQVDGFKDTEAGIHFFVKALDISPAVQVPSNMATKAVKAAFKRAEDEDPGSEGGTEAEAPPKGSTSKGSGKESSKAPKQDRDEQAEQEKQVAAALAAAADKKRADGEAATERKRQSENERKERDSERKEREKLTEDLAAAKVGESTQQAEKDRLLKDKQEKDRQLGDAKGQLQQLQKAKADQDKQLAATQLSEKNERAAKEKLLAEKPERDKQLADTKGRLQQVEKAKLDEDKVLAATQQSEKREREAKEKLQGTLQELAAREKERKGREEQEKIDREKLEEGPDLPGHLSEPITCTIPDEVTAGSDLFVHCLPQPGVGAKAVALYYRPGGSVLYNAAIMERSKKGWYVAMIPGTKIYGRLLHYYVEARDAHEKVAAANGKANSPNVATVRSGGGGGGNMRRAKSH